MNKVNLVFGSVYGNAQHVAEQLLSALQAQNFEVKLWHHDELVGFVPPQNELLMVICSTTGCGDLPDNIVPWYCELKSSAPYLPGLRYSVLALGDSSYDTFCHAGRQFDDLLKQLGGRRLAIRLELDACVTVTPDIDALNWLQSWNECVNTELT